MCYKPICNSVSLSTNPLFTFWSNPMHSLIIVGSLHCFLMMSFLYETVALSGVQQIYHITTYLLKMSYCYFADHNDSENNIWIFITFLNLNHLTSGMLRKGNFFNSTLSEQDEGVVYLWSIHFSSGLIHECGFRFHHNASSQHPYSSV